MKRTLAPQQQQAARGLVNMARVVMVLVLACLALAAAGCGTTQQLQLVKVPIAIECRVPAPDRPAMPADALTDASTLDQIVAALMSEIELREGYEAQLVVALATCRQPIDAPQK